ncbi:hypothetical protein Ddye_016463 [Dipteronia dyeriana]|uniref:MULE transposase domain-containing protein n=1 Tax=Dipteronia dyeriana TaxID=168575 RepID=A0AAD9WYV6_9ROSI|nr:hypothetical protein Ddye_016463 [Dipteronia dyeriana]
MIMEWPGIVYRHDPPEAGRRAVPSHRFQKRAVACTPVHAGPGPARFQKWASAVVKYDVGKYIVDLQSISIVPGTTYRTFIRNDDDVLFMLWEDRRSPKCSSSVVDIAGTSEVRPNVTEAGSDNTIMWIIPGAESYSFGIGGSRNLVEDEPTSTIYKGQFFPRKKDLERLVGHFAMLYNFEWKGKRSNKTTLHLVCLMDSCIWKLRAGRRDEVTYFQVRIFVNEHTCPLKEIHHRHRQASAVIIGEVVVPRLQQHDGRLMRPKDIIADMKTMYDIQIMYIIAVEGTHLKRRFGGTMFVATAQYENEQVYPIAFGYGDSENNLSLEWFLDCLRGALGHIDDLVFISDRHANIEVEISKVLPYATHTICCWHFYENIKKRYHRKDITVIMDKATQAYTELEYNRHKEELRNIHLNAYDYVIDTSQHKWSRVHCPNRRYRVMTTNVAECINSCLKFTRQLPMLTLAEFIRNMLQRWFHDRHSVEQSMRHQLTDASHLVILKRVEKCNFMTVNPIDWNIFSVKRSGKQWTVD